MKKGQISSSRHNGNIRRIHVQQSSSETLSAQYEDSKRHLATKRLPSGQSYFLPCYVSDTLRLFRPVL